MSLNFVIQGSYKWSQFSYRHLYHSLLPDSGQAKPKKLALSRPIMMFYYFKRGLRQQRSFVFLSKVLEHILDSGMTFLSRITFICMKTGWSHRNSRFFWWGAYKENVLQEWFSQRRQNRARAQHCWTLTSSATQALSLELKPQLVHFLKCKRLHSGGKHAPTVGILPILLLLQIKENLIRT